MHIADSKLDEVRTQGFTVIENFLSPQELANAREGVFSIFPKPEVYFNKPEKYSDLVTHQFAGMRLFPFGQAGLEKIVVHPDLVDAAERLCGTADLDLYKVELWAKYSGAVNYDQPHHRDFGNHSLVAPKQDDDFMQMTCFILLSDVTAEDGPTKIIPLNESEDIPPLPFHSPMGAHHDREIAITAPAGSLFIYHTNVVHRGSNFTGIDRSRFALLVDFQPRGRPWTGKMSWPNHANTHYWNEALARMSVRERSLFGFPPPDSNYWDEQTARDVGMRYPAMDMTPYRRAR